MNLKRTDLLVLISLTVLLLTFSAFAEVIEETKQPAEEKYVLILEGTPIEIKPLEPPTSSDAVENVPGFKGLSQIVIFRIEKIVKGHLEKIRVEPSSTLDQMTDAISSRHFGKIFDTDTRVTELNKSRFRIAVQDPVKTFGISSGEDLPKSKYRIFFKRYKEELTTFIMVKNEKLKEKGEDT